MKKKLKVLNAKGDEILLNDREKKIAKYNQKIANELGYNIDVTTLTQIQAQVSEQKFFEVSPADYVPVKIGEGAFADQLVSFQSFSTGGDFKTGIINTGANQSRLASADAGIKPVYATVLDWAKTCHWTISDLEKAARGKWDILTAKLKSRKKNWDLGIQETVFMGLDGDTKTLGLLNQAGVVNNTTVITKFIKDMTPTELKTLPGKLLGAHRSNCDNTAWPDRFVIPEADYLGLSGHTSPDFPLKSTLELLEESFKMITKKDFKILPLAYADKVRNKLAGASGLNRYALYNADIDSLRIDIPVDYTATAANSLNSYQFENVAYGQFTGLVAYRPKEILYFSHAL